MQNPFITIPEDKLETILHKAIKAKVIKALDVLWILSSLEDMQFGKLEIVRQDGKTLEIVEHGRRREPKFLQQENKFVKLVNKYIAQYRANN